MDPVPAIIEREPLATLIFLFPSHGLWIKKRLEQLVIWLVALESMIQELFWLGLTLRRAMTKWPFWAKEQEGFTVSCGDWKSLSSCSSCSFVKGDISELSCCPWFLHGLHGMQGFHSLFSSSNLVVFYGFPAFSIVCYGILQCSH